MTVNEDDYVFINSEEQFFFKLKKYILNQLSITYVRCGSFSGRVGCNDRRYGSG